MGWTRNLRDWHLISPLVIVSSRFEGQPCRNEQMPGTPAKHATLKRRVNGVWIRKSSQWRCLTSSVYRRQWKLYLSCHTTSFSNKQSKIRSLDDQSMDASWQKFRQWRSGKYEHCKRTIQKMIIVEKVTKWRHVKNVCLPCRFYSAKCSLCLKFA